MLLPLISVVMAFLIDISTFAILYLLDKDTKEDKSLPSCISAIIIAYLLDDDSLHKELYYHNPLIVRIAVKYIMNSEEMPSGDDALMFLSVRYWKRSHLSLCFVSCASRGNVFLTKYFLDQGADIHYNEDEALELASENNHLPVVDLLLDRGADITHVSIPDKSLPIIELFLSHNIRVAEDSALMHASEHGHLDKANFLLEHKANVHALDDRALKLAIIGSHYGMIKLLLDHGADPEFYELWISPLRQVRMAFNKIFGL